jgi:hypothetical protein
MQRVCVRTQNVRVLFNEDHGFTFSCPYNQRCLDQYYADFSFELLENENENNGLLMMLNEKKFGFYHKNLFVFLIHKPEVIYVKLGELLIQQQQQQQQQKKIDFCIKSESEAIKK